MSEVRRLYVVLSLVRGGHAFMRYGGAICFWILNIIPSRWCLRLSSRSVQPSSWRSLVWEVCLYAPVHARAAWRWVLSSLWASVSEHPSNMTSAYSRSGLIIALYSISRHCLGTSRLILLRRPIHMDDFATRFPIWSDQVSDVLKVNPRCLWVLTSLMIWPFRRSMGFGLGKVFL